MNFSMRFFLSAALLGISLLSPGVRGETATPAGLWDHPNLYAWCAVPFDAKKRGPEERAEMLHRLGFTKFVYDWRESDVPTFDAEIDALQKNGVALLGWWFPTSAADPHARLILETFKRHHIHPQLWVMGGGLPTQSPAEQEARVASEAARIRDLVNLAKPYGCPIELYNHNAWFGEEDNELAILDRLHATGIDGVGLVYNFSHAHDALHDDTTHFGDLWKRIQPHVVAVNITGMGPWTQIIYPSQGQHELEMMRTIQDSGWVGPVGLIAEKGGDAEMTLKNYLTGLDWLAAELRQPGSGGPQPFPLVPESAK